MEERQFEEYGTNVGRAAVRKIYMFSTTRAGIDVPFGMKKGEAEGECRPGK